MVSNNPVPRRTRLSSWKEIAAHLGRDVRTVLRWHKQRGLPIYRVPGGKGRSVFAYADELDAWAAGTPQPTTPQPATTPESTNAPARRPLRWIAAAIAACLLVAMAALGRARAPVAAVVIRGNDLVALDERQQNRWSYALPGETRPSFASSKSLLMSDMDADGKPDIVAALLLNWPDGSTSSPLYSLTDSGRLRWKVEIEDRVRFRSGEYGGPWVTQDVVAMAGGRGRRVAVAVVHNVWWPSMVMLMDADGRVTRSFVNSGWITDLNVTRDGKYLLAAGVSNARDGAVLAVLDAAAHDARSPEDEGSPFECLSCGRALPVRYFVFPRSELSLAAGRALLQEGIEAAPDGTILLRSAQNPANGAAEVIYEFGSDFTLRRATFSDVYWDWHRSLEREGVIRHSARDCPERGGTLVREWTPDVGWRQQLVH